MSAFRKMETDPYSSLKSKWIKDLKIKADTLKLTDQEIVDSSEFTGMWDNLLNITQILQVVISTTDKQE